MHLYWRIQTGFVEDSSGPNIRGNVKANIKRNFFN